MTRRCKHSRCTQELPPARQCDDFLEKKGFCSRECAVDWSLRKAQATIEKRDRQELRQRKEAIKTRAEHMREAQAVFNAYIRARDEGLPCISCGAHPNDNGLITGSRIDAGHYRSVGSCPALRFSPLNCWAQCVKCNQFLSGNTVEYRKTLSLRIGDEMLDHLEGQHDPKKHTIDELKEIKAHYRRLTRELKQKQEAA